LSPALLIVGGGRAPERALVYLRKALAIKPVDAKAQYAVFGGEVMKQASPARTFGLR
jgi:hypothetical protein